MRAPLLVLFFSGSILFGCEASTPTPQPATPSPYGAPQAQYPGAYGPQYGAPPQGTYPAAPYGAAPYPPQNGYAPAPYSAPQPPGVAPAAPALPSVPTYTGPDPITNVDMGWLRSHALALMQELIAVLPDVARVRVQSVPMVYDDTPGEVNAAAACTQQGAVLIITDGLLDVAARLSAAKANDDVFRTTKLNDYIQLVATQQKPDGPLVEPPAGFFDSTQQADPRRVARQHDVLDELLGFVIGHELGHHHLGHLPCTGGAGPLGLGEVVRGITSSAPIFNQPNEFEADSVGINNLLIAGAKRPTYHLTEGGALVIMQFFEASDQLSPESVLFAFNRTHPPPALRIPVIQQTANYYRMTGGWLPLPRF